MLLFSYVIDFSSNSNIEITRADGPEVDLLEIKPRNNFGLGIGYKYKDRFSLEVHQQTSRAVLGSYLLWNSEYKSLAVIVGCSIF